jgi:ribosome biogenesis GTPase A
MAQIQWYPGHMHKAIKGIRDVLSRVDMFVELLDARIPASSSNPVLTNLRGNKPCIKVLSKSDLADPERTGSWQAWLESEHKTRTVISSTSDRQQVTSLADQCRKLFTPDNERVKSITVMIVGIPNVGKSTIINILADRKIAKTGNEAAVTRMQQRIQLDHGIVLLDTPGVLWPKVENPASGYRLAATGAIRDTAFTHEDVAWFLAGFLLAHYPSLVDSRYQFKALGKDAGALLEHIGRQRGCLKAGNRVDMDRVAKLLLNEFREGKIGRITLETPAMIQQEQFEVELVRQQKAAKKEARKKKWKKSSTAK